MKENFPNLLNKESVSKKQLDILDTISKVLSCYEIKYFLAYGTLLGAIRHKGFIPWDDDIDLGMMRSDFNKLINIDWSLYGLQLISNSTVQNCQYAHAKIADLNSILIEDADLSDTKIGVNVDIFPIDYISDKKILVNLQKILLSFFHYLRD